MGCATVLPLVVATALLLVPASVLHLLLATVLRLVPASALRLSYVRCRASFSHLREVLVLFFCPESVSPRF